MALSFHGGVVLNEHKDTSSSPIQRMPAPPFVTIPLAQHIGAPAESLVAVGDFVKIGQKIGENTAALCCPVHASVSGKVVSVAKIPSATGAGGMAITIENDFKEEISPEISPFTTPIFEASPEELIARIREAGISGMGGATFPTYAKIQSAVGKAKRIIINCAECEPYITANHRLLLEHPEEVINGVKILLRATGAEKVIFAVEDNKEDAAEKLMEYLGGSDVFRVTVLKTKYPQGDERQLIAALSGREIPQGKIPADIGYVIFNAETCWAVYKAFAKGFPVIERIVTVAGDCIGAPANLLVRIGTSFEDAIHYCGGFSQKPDKIISGGPMMGFAQWSLKTPVTKGTGAILAMTSLRLDPERAHCIHCGRCVRVCPMHLMPVYLSRYITLGKTEEAEKISLMSCSECGCCTYVCPGKIPLLQNIRVGKDLVRAKARKS